jgi:hypothetical protein
LSALAALLIIFLYNWSKEHNRCALFIFSTMVEWIMAYPILLGGCAIVIIRGLLKVIGLFGCLNSFELFFLWLLGILSCCSTFLVE